MKKFKLSSGQVRAEITLEKYTFDALYNITFIGKGLYGWGISKSISKEEFYNFNLQQAKTFANKAMAMLVV